MIRFIFDVTKFPDDLSWDYALQAEVESENFSININDVEVFKDQEFLVFELFDAFRKWFSANENEKEDFYFVSMDEEEEPIVAFMYDESLNKYRFDSVFKRADAIVTFSDIANSYRQFKNDLRDQLKKKYNFSLDAD